jgi:hypothetical protein
MTQTILASAGRVGVRRVSECRRLENLEGTGQTQAATEAIRQ